MLSLVYPNHS
uniref:Uncharacterized protein n=1 Tax=Arundo donax TaxID=35708 RepID=A0A0A8YLB2_ARUDO